MAAVTKGSGDYFYKYDRVWAEALQTGVAPFVVGNFGGRLAVPDVLTRDYVRDVCRGTNFLKHVQKNRVGAYDVTFTFSKSVSIALFGLTPHAQWAQKSVRPLVDATRPEIERIVGNQRANAGAQGQRKVPSQGAAFGFPHWESSRKAPHGHIHYCVPNLTVPATGKGQSVANAREMFVDQGLMRARSHKRLDDILQDRGFVTRREGKAVGIAGIPDAMVRQLSPSRQAMNEALKKKGFTSPKAQAFYARHARQGAGPRTLGDPEQFNKACWQVAAQHGLTGFQQLKRPAGTPAPHRDRYRAASVAHDVAAEARDALSRKHGTFTAEQFLERVFTRGIGKATTFEALDTHAQAALKNPKILGIEKKIQPDGTVRYAGPASKATQQQATSHFRTDTKAAWEELKRAAKGLGEAVFVKTAQKVAEVTERLAQAVNPPARTLVVNAADLGTLTASLRPTPYLQAHAKAILAGLRAPGNPHERAYVAERAFAGLRDHPRLAKNTVVVVENGTAASARDLHVLSKIARRDGASVILTDGSIKGPSRGQAHGHAQHTTPGHGRFRTP